MGFYQWRPTVSSDTAREPAAAHRIAKADHDDLLARWREAMAFERKANWPTCLESAAPRVRPERQRD